MFNSFSMRVICPALALLFAALMSACGGGVVMTVGDSSIRLPPALTGHRVSPTGVRLSWQAVRGASYYRLYRARFGDSIDFFGGGGQILLYGGEGLGLRAGAENSFVCTDTSVVAGISYTYWVEICTGSNPGQCRRTGTDRAVVAPGSPLPAGSLLAPEPQVDFIAATGQISVSWDSQAGAGHYRLHRSDNACVPGTPVYAGPDLRYSDTDLENGGRYYYVLTICADEFAANCTEPGAVASALAVLDLPGRPRAPTILVASATQVDISWSAVTDGDYYRLQRSPDLSDDFVEIYAGANLSYSDTGRSIDGIWYYNLLACLNEDRQTCSLPSEPAAARMPARLPVLPEF